MLANLRESTNSTSVCDVCLQKMETREIVFQWISIQPFNHLLPHTYIWKLWPLKIRFCEKKNWLKYPIQPFNQLLRHTYFENVDFLKKILANLRESTNSTTNCNTYFQKMETGKLIISRISIQPFQPSFATHIFRKLDFSRKYFQQVGRFNHSTSFARHTFSKMSFCKRKVT